MFAFKAWKLYTMHWFAEMFLSRCVNITTRDYKDDVLEWKNPFAEILGTPTIRSGYPNHMYDVCVMAKAGNMTSSIKRASSARAVTMRLTFTRPTLADGLKAYCCGRCEKSEQMAESLLDRKYYACGLETISAMRLYIQNILPSNSFPADLLIDLSCP